MPSKKKEDFSEEKIKCINKIVDTWMSYQRMMKRIPGVQVSILHKDKILFSKGYGFADIEEKKETEEETLYRIASISKLFTAISVMQLVEEGKINLDYQVSKYVKWLKDSNQVTVRQLLTHSSGIDRDGETDHWSDDNFPDIEKVKKYCQNDAFKYEPLDKFKYSNLGYAVLGKLIEDVSGLSYKEYVEKNIIKKLGLLNTYVDMDKKIEGKIASGYGRDIPGLRREKFGNPPSNSMAPATGFVSNAKDMCKFLHAQAITNDLLLKRETKKEMQRIQWIEESNYDLIRGLGYEMIKFNGKILRGHSGGFAGFSSQIYFDREKDIGVAVLANGLGANAHGLTKGIFNIIYSILDKFDSYSSFRVKDEKLEKYEGLFYGRWADIEVVEINRSLNLIFPIADMPLDTSYKLKPQKENSFKIEGNNNYDYIGEEFSFLLEKDKVKGIKVGPVNLIPYEEFLKKHAKS